jgi:hypothetical protein
VDTHHFILFVRGADVLTEAVQDALREVGCRDASFGERDGVQYAEFEREAKSFRRALRSAIRQIGVARPEIEVIRVEPDELVTLAAIAERSGLSREGVRLLASGKRGPGSFPAPIAQPDGRTRLWSWPEVARWLVQHGKAQVLVETKAAELVAAYNAALKVREHARNLRKRDRALIAETLDDRPLPQE